MNQRQPDILRVVAANYKWVWNRVLDRVIYSRSFMYVVGEPQNLILRLIYVLITNPSAFHIVTRSEEGEVA